MATMAKAIPKPEVAAGLRKRIAALTAEISDLNEKLAKAQGTLDLFTSQRKQIGEAAADGQTPKNAPALFDKIAEAELPVTALRDRLAARIRDLDTAKGQLGEVENEIAIENARQRREARFAELEAAGKKVAAEIAAKISSLIETDLLEFDRIGRALTVEFVGGQLSTSRPEATRARRLIAELIATWQDGAQLRAERKLRRGGWTDADLVLTIQSLRPPRS